ncbi:hypothetical protein [Ruegeria atlantica]|uniref:Uncharacterized protein n=1 Tax=Ruegeria atlantica TaxID=81569 RepID=A0A0N7LQN4_9RHOB|nr:hypothetical protein [Ruegeria atlantica]CUH48508.1 hypothetical protein RUA4292_02688 [Ruegeria atlantica]
MTENVVYRPGCKPQNESQEAVIVHLVIQTPQPRQNALLMLTV